MAASTSDAPQRRSSPEAAGTPEGALLVALIVAALASGLLWAVVMPPWQVPDEPFYFAFAQQRAIDMGLLRLDAPIAAPSGATLPLFAWAALPVVASVRNPNSAMYLLRFFGVLFGLGVIMLGYLTAREIFGEDKLITWGAALALALWPVFGHFYAEGAPHMVSNLGGALFFWGAVRVIRRGWKLVGAAACLVGAPLAVLSAPKGLFMLGPLALLPLFALMRPGDPAKGRRLTESRVVAVATAAGILATGLVVSASGSMLLQPVKLILSPAGWLMVLDDLAAYRPRYLLETLWGAWGWGTGVSVSAGWYRTFDILAAAALVGLALLFVRLARQRADEDSRTKLAALAFLGLGALAAFAAAVTYGRLIGFGAAKWLFASLVPMSILAVAGLAEWVLPGARRAALVGFALLLVAYQVIAVWVLVVPHFYEHFPAQLAAGAQNLWKDATAKPLVFSKRPAPLLFLPTYLALQALLVAAVGFIAARLSREGDGA